MLPFINVVVYLGLHLLLSLYLCQLKFWRKEEGRGKIEKGEVKGFTLFTIGFFTVYLCFYIVKVIFKW